MDEPTPAPVLILERRADHLEKRAARAKQGSNERLKCVMRALVLRRLAAELSPRTNEGRDLLAQIENRKGPPFGWRRLAEWTRDHADI